MGSEKQGFLKEKLTGYRVEPPEEVWNHISARLGGSRRRRMIFFTLSAAASLALAVTLGIVFWGTGPDRRIAVDSAVDRAVDPADDPALEPAVDPASDPAVEPAVDPASDPAVEPAVDPAAEESGRQRNQMKARAGKQPSRVAESRDPVAVPLFPDEAEPADRLKVLPLPAPGIPELLAVDGEREGFPGEQEVTPEEPEGFPEEWEEFPVEQEILPVQKPGRWVVGAAMSPLYSFRDAESSAIGTAENHESGMLAYSGGVQVGYRAASRLALETGLFFTKMGIRIGAPGIQLLRHSYEIDFSPAEGTGSERTKVAAISNSVGNIVATSGQVYVNSYLLNSSHPDNSLAEQLVGASGSAEDGISQHLEYLEFPFNLRYTLVDRDMELQLVGGMSTNFLVRNYVTSEVNGNTQEIGYLANIRNVNYSGNAGLGMIYHINSSFSFRLEPRFRYFLNSVNDESLPPTRPYTLGLYTGLNIVF